MYQYEGPRNETAKHEATQQDAGYNNSSNSHQSSLLTSITRFVWGEGDERSNSMTLEEFRGRVMQLLSYLKSPEESFLMMTKQDVSQVILPPTLKQVLYLSSFTTHNNQQQRGSVHLQNKIVWEALSLSFNAIQSYSKINGMPLSMSTKNEEDITSGCSTFLSSILPQSLLLKVIPYAIDMTFVFLRQEDDDSSSAAATAMGNLIPFFHPTNVIDILCSWIQRVAAAISFYHSETGYQQHQTAAVEILVAALIQRLLQCITQSIGTSTKHVFLQVTKILVPLSQLHSYFSQTEIQQKLIQDVLRMGLFHPEYHLDGYRNCDGFLTANSDAGTSAQQHKKKKRKIKALTTEDDPSGRTAATIRGSCYQQQLFAGINISLKNQADADSLVKLLPHLFLEFIQQTLIWSSFYNKNDSLNKKDQNINAVATKMHFQFWSCITGPLMDILTNAIDDHHVELQLHLHALQALETMLQTMIQQHVYLPSSSTTTILQEYSLRLLRHSVSTVMSKNPSSKKLTITERNINSTEILVFQKFMELNHAILHENLSDLIRISVLYYHFILDGNTISASNTDQKRKNEARSFLSCIIDTYEKLRQLEYLFQSMFQAINFSGYKDEHEFSSLRPVAISSMFCFLQDVAIVQSLSSAIYTCPQGTIETLWKIFNDWIASFKHQKASEESSLISVNRNALKWGVDFFVIFIRCLRVDRHTAERLQNMCELSLTTCVSQLVATSQLKVVSSSTVKSIKNTSNTGGDCPSSPVSCVAVLTDGYDLEYGLLLCGWLVDLHSRCCFWSEDVSTVEEKASSSFFKIKHTGSKSIPDIAGFLTTAAKILLLNDYSKIEAFFEANNNKVSHGAPAASLNHVPMLKLLRTLQHLTFHRVQQLSAMVYLYEQRESINEIDLSVIEPTQRESEKILSEVTLLVEFLFFIANILSADISVGHDRSSSSICCSNMGNLDSPWILLAQSVAIWAPYASVKNIQVFLKWQFNNSVEESLRRDELNKKSRARNGEVKVGNAGSLFQDASFLEVSQVADYFMTVGISIVLEHISCAMLPSMHDPLDKRSTGMVPLLDHTDLLLSPLDLHWKTLDPLELSKPLLATTQELLQISNPPSNSTENRNHMLMHAEGVLKILNGVNLQYVGRNHRLVTDCALRLHHFLRSLLLHHQSEEEKLRNRLIMLLCLTQTLLARCFDCSEMLEWIQVHDESVLSNLLMRFHEDMLSVCMNDFTDISIRSLLISSTVKVSEQAMHVAMLDSQAERPVFVRFIKTAGTLCDSQKSEAVAQNLLFVRHVIRKFVVLSQNADIDVARTVLGGPDSHARRECYKFANKIQTNLLEFSSLTDESFIFESDPVLLKSDLFHFVGILEAQRSPSTNVVLLCEGITKHATVMLKRLSKIFLDIEDDPSRDSAIIYFIASVCACDAYLKDLVCSDNFLLLVFKMLQKMYTSCTGKTDALLDSAFCSAIRHADISQLESFGCHVISNDERATREGVLHAASTLHVLRLALLATKGRGQRDALASTISSYWGAAVGMFQPFYQYQVKSQHLSLDVWSSCMATGIDFFVILLEKSDVMVLKGRGIGLLLSHISELFSKEKGKTLSFALPTSLFSSCCSFLSSCLKRHPKHVYGCVPSFFCVVRSCFLHLVNASVETKMDCKSFREQATEFTRLCEMLPQHRDIFKKHVIGILLDFALALKNGLSSDAKFALLPSVYVLLEVCSTFEKQQLNVLMDVESKVLFRSVFQNYQKLHHYKGQF